jgi:hypothetical protein
VCCAHRYDVSKDKKESQVASGGIGCYWKIYDAVSKKTKERVSVHILTKDDLPKKLRNDGFYKVLHREVSACSSWRNIIRFPS